LFSALHGLVRSAEANFNLVVQVFLKYRRQAGLGEVKEIESVKEILSRKRENEGLKETEASLARTIEIFDYDKELFDSIQALIGAVHEFSKPPCFLTRKQYDKCVKSLEEIRTVVAGPFVDRQSSLVRIPGFLTGLTKLNSFSASTGSLSGGRRMALNHSLLLRLHHLRC